VTAPPGVPRVGKKHQEREIVPLQDRRRMIVAENAEEGGTTPQGTIIEETVRSLTP